MKKVLFPGSLFLIFFLPLRSFSQASVKELLIQKWKYTGIEEFSVVYPPDSMMKDDWLLFSTDGRYQSITRGKSTSGTWKINEASKIISLTDAATKKTISYNLKGITPGELTLEYQTPDLVRTKYRYIAVQE